MDVLDNGDWFGQTCDMLAPRLVAQARNRMTGVVSFNDLWKAGKKNLDNALKIKGLFVDVDHSVDFDVTSELELRPSAAVSPVG